MICHKLRWASLVSICVATHAQGQWTHRYPLSRGFAYNVYIEGYELPSLTNGPSGFTTAGDSTSLIAAFGHLWRFDVASRRATQVTDAGENDARPALSPDGKQVAFIRDDGRVLSLVVRDIATGAERILDRGMTLDPMFMPDGRSVVYSNIDGGDIDLFEMDLATGTRRVVRGGAGHQLRAVPLPSGDRLIYVRKPRGAPDEIRLLSLRDSSEQVLVQGQLLTQLRPALSPDGRTLVYGMPTSAGWQLCLLDVVRPLGPVCPDHRVDARPVDPAWSADGQHIFYTETTVAHGSRLFRLPAGGGAREAVAPVAWTFARPMGAIRLQTTLGGKSVASRVEVRDERGHPRISTRLRSYFDGQSGRHYQHSPGEMIIAVPAGRATVAAVHGFFTSEARTEVVVRAGDTVLVRLPLRQWWEPAASGWRSADHHVHINYGGAVALRASEVLPMMASEALDVVTPMLANLANRLEDQAMFGRRVHSSHRLLPWSQEVRSQFAGHVGLLGTSTLFFPWMWGPGADVFAHEDRLNADALDHARREGALTSYVHPIVTARSVLSAAGRRAVPLLLVADAVHGKVDLLDIACLWSSTHAAVELWYLLLNAGIPVSPSAGTDAMLDLHRMMAVGSTRVMVQAPVGSGWPAYRNALKQGASVVTTGPMLELTVGGVAPGAAVVAGSRRFPFRLTLTTAVPLDSADIVVNGEVAWRWRGALDRAQRSTQLGELALPTGGWVAARAWGPATPQWPTMAEFAFAHTGPIWIKHVGSTEQTTRVKAAMSLRTILDSNRERVDLAYPDGAPRMRAYLQHADSLLRELAHPI